ncbi:MAG TPA: Hsp70 family protein [Cellvibrionaceae bacterium]
MELFFGIDLGTSNSAIACFDGTQLSVIPNSRGEGNTPSIVRFTEHSVIVGAKAQNFLFKDSLHTHKEFKRLMGTQVKTNPDSFGNTYTAEQLSSEILKALRQDAVKFKECAPDNVVVTVPALFELPQSNATAEAGRLAGFKKVELLPEPVASALAAGWSDQDNTQAWLVFDLGGGTFDVSLVESRDGLLRVVGHDGDNFLGGRDIDRILVEWLLNKLRDEKSIVINPDQSEHISILRHLYQEVEKAKIRLSTQERTSIELDFDWYDDYVEVDFLLSRTELESLIAPIVERAIEVCLRLISQQGLQREQISRVVLVGGPAHMPVIKTRVAAELAPIAEGNGDPMTLVARGAALYAATIGFKNNPQIEAAEQARASKNACELWVQYPSVCADLQPDVMGRVLDAKQFLPVRVQLIRDDGQWQTNEITLDENGVFFISVQLQAARNNRFLVKLCDKNGAVIPASPESISIVHGLTISDPPLSRSIGVALANGQRRSFIDRGTPLPAKRTFLQYSTETLVPQTQQQLNIPIVQGERAQARFCRKVGNLVIAAHELQQQLPAGSPIEITIEVDRGGNLRASALIVDHNKLISAVAELLTPSADPQVLQLNFNQVQSRVMQQQREAFARHDQNAIAALDQLAKKLHAIGKDLVLACNDQDAALRAQRNLMEVEADLEAFETRDQLDELLSECEIVYLNTRYQVDNYGNEIEKKMLADCEMRFKKALELKRVQEVERLIEQMSNIFNSAYRRNPEFWADQFHAISSRIHEATNISRANVLVAEGRSYLANSNKAALESCVRQLWNLIPDARVAGEQNHQSGIQ